MVDFRQQFRRRALALEMLRQELPRRFGALRRAGRHGNAAVLQATDLLSGGEVAIKLGRETEPLASSELGREFRLLSRIEHPNVVGARALEATASGIPCLVLDWAGPLTLQDACRGRPTARFLECVRQLVLGLDAIHVLGFLHGDLKPSHVLMQDRGEPRAVLVDLGLARPCGQVLQITGTPGFLAPEMLGFGVVDQRSDWFSLGMTVLRCVVRPLPRALEDTELALRRGSRWREAVHRAAEGLPRRLRDLLCSVLEPVQEARPRTVADVLELLGTPRAKRIEHVARVLARPPLIGRRRPLARLLRALDEARTGGGWAILVEGPAGCGKSRLLEELGIEAALRGATVLSVRLEAGQTDLEGLMRRLEGELPRAVPAPEASAPEQRPAAQRDVLRLLDLFRRLGRSQARPAVLLLDGPPGPPPTLLRRLGTVCRLLTRAHDLDQVLGRRSDGPGLLLVAGRREGGAIEGMERLRLGKLGPLSSGRLRTWGLAAAGLPASKARPARSELPGRTLRRIAWDLNGDRERPDLMAPEARTRREPRASGIGLAKGPPSFAQGPGRTRGRLAQPLASLTGRILGALLTADARALELANGGLLRLLLERGELVAAGRCVGRFELGAEHDPLRAELALLEGRAREALALARSVLARPEADGAGPSRVEARLVAGRAADALARPALAGRLLERALEEALGLGSEVLLIRCLRHLVSHAARPGSRGGIRKRAELWSAQLRVRAERVQDDLERARARFALAEWLWSMQRPGQARIQARRALASFIRLGARLDREACRKFLASPVPPRRSPRPRGAASF
jgi:hypothetical protein